MILFNPTSVTQVLKVVIYELKHNNLRGIYNLANKGITSHYEYGIFINNFLKANKNIEKVNKINRHFDNYGKFVMSLKKISKLIPLEPWQEDLKVYLNNILTY